MIPIAEPCLGEEELSNAIEAIKSGWISSQGPFIREFEEKFAKFCGTRYGVATSNGTVALHLALKALGIGEGDEVIVPVLTFVATANAVTYCNAKPVFVDVDPAYWCMDPSAIEARITPRTRALIPVHLYGHPCDMDAILDIARRRRLHVVEDAAEAHGATYKGKKVGTFGQVSCFSFYGNKIISTGEGGMCLTDDRELAEKMRVLRDHGMNPSRRYWYDVVGFNYRMTNLQAAVGTAQVDRLDMLIAARRQLAAWYEEAFADLSRARAIRLHPQMPWAKNVYWMYSILLEDSFGLSRDNLMESLKLHGIETRPFFHPLHLMPPYRERFHPENFHVATDISSRGINLPSGYRTSKEQSGEIAHHLSSLVGVRST